MASKDGVYWERYDNIDLGMQAARVAGVSVTGTHPVLGLRIVATPTQIQIYRREYERLKALQGET